MSLVTTTALISRNVRWRIFPSQSNQAGSLISCACHSRGMIERWSLPARQFTQFTKSDLNAKVRATLKNFLGPKPMPERYTVAWYKEVILICTVFAITGTSTMMIVRPAVTEGLGIKGSFKDGPWSYRISSVVLISPVYASLLVLVGTLFGRHFYFRHLAVKIFSRFGIPPELLDKNYHRTKGDFRKW